MVGFLLYVPLLEDPFELTLGLFVFSFLARNAQGERAKSVGEIVLPLIHVVLPLYLYFLCFEISLCIYIYIYIYIRVCIVFCRDHSVGSFCLFRRAFVLWFALSQAASHKTSTQAPSPKRNPYTVPTLAKPNAPSDGQVPPQHPAKFSHRFRNMAKKSLGHPREGRVALST